MSFGVIRVPGSRLALAIFACALNAQAAPKVAQGVIDRVVDGDTVNVQPNSIRDFNSDSEFYEAADPIKIRMLGIDAPETHFPTPKHGVVGQQPWGDLSTAYLSGFVKPGSKVTLQTWGKDRYQRTLGYVFSNKVDINLQMVRGGWAVPYVICSGPSCNQQFFTNNRVREYLMSCDAARSEGRAIFSRSKPLREMPFEFRMRMTERKPDKYVGNYDTMELHEPKDYKKVDLCRRIFFMTKTAALKIGFQPVKR